MFVCVVLCFTGLTDLAKELPEDVAVSDKKDVRIVSSIRNVRLYHVAGPQQPQTKRSVEHRRNEVDFNLPLS